jgi:hypothetical protein
MNSLKALWRSGHPNCRVTAIEEEQQQQKEKEKREANNLFLK